MIFRMVAAEWKYRKDKMNKEIEQKIADWKAANAVDQLYSIFGLTAEQMAEAAEMWKQRKATGDKLGAKMPPDWDKPTRDIPKEESYFGYKIGDQLKIKMPDGDYNLTVKDDTRLTRQEAIDKIRSVNGAAGNNYAGQLIDTYVALGMLKLKDEKKIEKDWRDEPIVKKAEELIGDLIGSKKDEKKVEQPRGFIDGIPAEDWDTVKSVETVIEYNEFINRKIVRKLLNIIKRKQKPVAFEFLDDDARTIQEAAGTIAAGNMVSVNFTKTQQLISLIDKLLNIIKRGKA